LRIDGSIGELITAPIGRLSVNYLPIDAMSSPLAA
jgi:hypothetical protein